MRWLLCTFLLLIPMIAQSATVDRIQFVRAGLWTQPDGGGRPVFARATDAIPAKLGTIFGVEWRATGRPNEGTANVKIRWLYPEPGMRHPVTRNHRRSDEFNYPVAVGSREITFLELHSDYMLIPGKWVLEIGDSESPLLRHEFTLAR